MKVRAYCPAKVNLELEVGPLDARGYHPLHTIFQAIGLYDILDLEFEGTPGETRFEVTGAELPAENTVTKALRLSREIFPVQPTRVRLEKRIPMQSGLGGGSSDAAGILRALQAVSAGNLSSAIRNPKSEIRNPEGPIPEVVGVAAAVGADVPFFLTGGRALGDGYGDRITPLPDEPEEWLVVAKPPVGCSTAEMYGKLDELAANPSGLGARRPAPGTVHNDFEQVAPAECLTLIERLISLGARDAALCGSGSAVFGRFASCREAERAKSALDVNAWAAKALTRAESLRIERL